MTAAGAALPLVLAAEEGGSVSGSRLGWFLAAAALLILFNAFYVAYEFAILAARRSAFSSPGEAHKRTSQATLSAMTDLSMQLAGAQLGITMASVALGFVAEPAFESVFEAALGRSFSPEVTAGISLVAALGLVAFLHLVVGEMVPKNLALAAPEPTMRWLVLPYRLYMIVFRPFIVALNSLANQGCRALGVEPRDELVRVHTVGELTAIVNRSREQGAIERDDAELLSGSLRFTQRSVGEVAVPLAALRTLPLGATAEQAEQLAAETGRERIAIAHVDPGRPLAGYVHARDLCAIAPDRRRDPLPVELIRTMATVRAERSLIEVLRAMRRVNRQVAVVEQDGVAVGIVSVEQVTGAILERLPDNPDNPTAKPNPG
ncbi:MAG: CNNM domain-containing protein [Actinomycetota bacterium]